MAGPYHCRSVRPETDGIGVDRFPCKMISFHMNVLSYIRAVRLLAGQILKGLKCGHAPHVTAQIGFRLKKAIWKVLGLLPVFGLLSVLSPTSFQSFCFGFIPKSTYLLNLISHKYTHKLSSQGAGSDLFAVHIFLFTSGLSLRVGFL